MCIAMPGNPYSYALRHETRSSRAAFKEGVRERVLRCHASAERPS